MRALAILLLLVVGGCKARRAATGEAPRSCQSNADCPPGWACLDRRCADARHGAALTNSANAVTPQKVKAELERINAAEEQRLDKVKTE